MKGISFVGIHPQSRFFMSDPIIGFYFLLPNSLGSWKFEQRLVSSFGLLLWEGP